MCAAQGDLSTGIDLSNGHFLLPQDQTEEEKSNGLWPYFTPYGSRVVLTSDELKLASKPITSACTGPSIQQKALLRKIRSGFQSKIDDRMTVLEYKPLPSSTSIRLIKILPAADDGIIRLSMELYDLRDKNMPPYDCLSYTWGNPHSSLPDFDFHTKREAEYGESALWPVECNSQLLWVRRNLFDALRRIPHTRRSTGTHDLLDAMIGVTTNDASDFDEAQGVEIAKTMIETCRSYIDSFGESGLTPLALAASKGYTDLCQLLIKTGWDPYQKDASGLTAFDYAADNGHVTLSDSMAELVRTKAASDGRLIWIDAICINQQDLAERSSQVQLMNKIYSSATQVVVWLGTLDPLSRIGLNTLDKLKYGLATGKLFESTIVPFAPYDQSKAFEDAGISKVDDIGWAGLASIYVRPYFRRIWTLQEAVLAQRAVVFLGSEEVQWEALLLLANELTRMEARNGMSLSTRFRIKYGMNVEREAAQLHQYRTLRERGKEIQSPKEWQSRKTGDESDQDKSKSSQVYLSELLIQVATSECHDPRDRVYGLLGMTAGHPKSPQIVPDYGQPVPKLWAQVTRHHIKVSEGDISGLGVLKFMRDTTQTQQHDLPSWVPDYGYIGTAPLGTIDFCADGGVCHMPQDSDVWNQLTVRGIKIDSINAAAQERYRSPEAKTLDLDPSWFELILKMDAVHRTGQCRTEVLWRTLCGDQLAAAKETYERGRSPAPASYGKEFTDLICTMMTVNRLDVETSPELDFSTMTPFAVEKVLAVYSEVGFEDRSPSAVMRIMLTVILATTMSKDPVMAETMEALCQLAKDETCFTPTFEDIVVHLTTLSSRMKHDSGKADDVVIPCGMARHRQQGGFFERFTGIYGHRRLFLTKALDLGMGPASLRIGDEVWVLAGAKAPFVLRPKINSEGRRTYQLLGETYAHGFMRGEAVTQANTEFESIVLE